MYKNKFFWHVYMYITVEIDLIEKLNEKLMSLEN